MTDRQNAAPPGFKARLRGKETLSGFFMGLPSPAMVEMIAYAGFDFVIIDAEHGPCGTETLEHMLRAAQACNIAGIVRVAGSGTADILHALDAGADAILVPHVISAGDAAEIVANAYFPPHGRRGISGLTRAARYGFASDYLVNRHSDTAVIAMIEDAEALPHIAGIVATPGVDALFIGPADLAGSMGLPGQPRHGRVLAAVAGIIETARRATGEIALATTPHDRADAVSLHQAGVRLICYSAVSLFRDGLRALRTDLDRMAADARGTMLPQRQTA